MSVLVILARKKGKVLTIILRGKIDATTDVHFQSELEALDFTGISVIDLDFEHVSHISIKGLTPMNWLRTKAKRLQVSMYAVNLKGQPLEKWQELGFEALFDVRKKQ